MVGARANLNPPDEVAVVEGAAEFVAANIPPVCASTVVLPTVGRGGGAEAARGDWNSPS